MPDKEKKGKGVELESTFDQDSKRFHRFVIDEGQGLVGNIYVPKDMDIPKFVTVNLNIKD